MTSTKNSLRRRAVVILAGTAIAALASAAPAFAEDNPPPKPKPAPTSDVRGGNTNIQDLMAAYNQMETLAR